MSEKININSILEHLSGEIKLPSPDERTVTAKEVETAAKRMAARGYRPSESSLTALERYLRGYSLWLSGDVGTGKTAFFKALGREIIIYPMLLTAGRQIDDLRGWFDEHVKDEIVLDDIGTEPVFNHYGAKFELLPWILEMRMRCKARTHITSNLKPAVLFERYGARTLDRFAELFSKIDFRGASLRTSPRVAASAKRN